MAKSRKGLHKEIASIFDGVPITRGDGTGPTGHGGRPEFNKRPKPTAPPKPSAPLPRTPDTRGRQQPEPVPPADAAPPRGPELTAPPKIGVQLRCQKSWEQIKNKLFAGKPGVDGTRQKVVAVLVPVLFVVFIIVLVKSLMAPVRGRQQAPAAAQANVVAAAGAEIDWRIPAPYPATLRDPMQFGSISTATDPRDPNNQGRLIVKGTVYSETEPLAVVGTQIVREGDRVLGATVVKINRSSVEFEMNGKRWTQKVE